MDERIRNRGQERKRRMANQKLLEVFLNTKRFCARVIIIGIIPTAVLKGEF